MIKNLKAALSKMSQRSMWRGKINSSNMINEHGLEGVRANLTQDKNSLSKENNFTVGGKAELDAKKAIQNAKNTSNDFSNQNLGGSILDSLR